jgi:hypothetical protein
MLVFLDRLFSAIAGEIDQYLVLPLLYHFGWMEWEELSFDWALVCVYGGGHLRDMLATGGIFSD